MRRDFKSRTTRFPRLPTAAFCMPFMEISPLVHQLTCMFEIRFHKLQHGSVATVAFCNELSAIGVIPQIFVY